LILDVVVIPSDGSMNKKLKTPPSNHAINENRIGIQRVPNNDKPLTQLNTIL
jgi:hypothetical protein